MGEGCQNQRIRRQQLDVRDRYARFSEIARFGTTVDATYIGQILVPWQRKLTTSPSAPSNERSRLEYRPFRIRMV